MGIRFIGIVVLLSIVLCACTTMYDATILNRQNLLYVSLGMTREQVLALMGEGACAVYEPKPMTIQCKDPELGDTYLMFQRGFSSFKNPHKTETQYIRGRPFIIDYYVTGSDADANEVIDTDLTPLVFDNNKLVGWGWEYLAELKGENNYYHKIVVRGL